MVPEVPCFAHESLFSSSTAAFSYLIHLFSLLDLSFLHEGSFQKYNPEEPLDCELYMSSVKYKDLVFTIHRVAICNTQK